MERICEMIKLRDEDRESYLKLHKKIWPEIAALIRDCNIRNYSIFERKGMLFAYYEYIGDNFEADIKKMEDNPVNQKWWAVCKPCQRPLDDRQPGEWWARAQEIWHQD